jgi:NAD(P)H-dependent FMN reductase
MKYIISGTNRPQSRSRQLAGLIQSLYRAEGEEVEIIDLAKLPLHLLDGSHYGKDTPPGVQEAIAKVGTSEGLIIVCPEYNGSMPGALKYFIDHWKYPESFEHRPVCFVGLGGLFGGLRPVEHLQQVFGYRNAYVFPQRVFLSNVWNTLKDGHLNDKMAMTLLENQAKGFTKFCRALQSEGLDANGLRASNKKA